MNIKKPVLLSLGGLAVAFAIWFGFAWYHAHNKLVTLNVHRADFHKVIREIEWQTWERILVHQSVTGLVTLNVKNAHLHDVLDILSEQTASRWSTFYPLYAKPQSLLNFKQAVQGGTDPATCGWTNLAARGGMFMRGGMGRGGGMGGPGMFGNSTLQPSELVSVNCVDQDLPIATMALARFGQTRVVPEDGTEGKVRLILNQAPMEEAVDKLAKQVKRNWKLLYAFEPERGGRGRDFAGGPPRGDGEEGPRWRGRGPMGDGEPMINVDTNGTNTITGTNAWAGRRAAMEQRLNNMVATMTPEQQKQIEAMRNMTPEERQQRREEMFNSPQFQQNMQNRAAARLLNTTPEQRVDRTRMRVERQQRIQQQRGN